jgi:hypothetical protein
VEVRISALDRRSGYLHALAFSSEFTGEQAQLVEEQEWERTFLAHTGNAA